MLPADQILRSLLDYFEEKIDLVHVERARARHLSMLNYDALDVPVLVCYIPYEAEKVKPYPYSETFDDPAKMMINELLVGFTSVYHSIEIEDDSPCCLRPNFGTGIIASMFGAEVRLVENNMPWVMPLGDLSRLEAIADGPLPDVLSGLGQRVVDQYAYYHNILSDYPNCRAAFEITLPDLQGPFDTAELLWGSEILLALYTHEKLVRKVLSKITEQMLSVHAFLVSRIRDSLNPTSHYQHATGVKGKLLIRDDTPILMSPKHYRSFVYPYNCRLASELEGVGIHFCGDGQHQIDNMLSIPGMQSLDMGQSEMMDIDVLYARASACRVPLLRVNLPEEELTAASVRSRFPCGVSLIYHAETVDEARSVWERYVDEV